MAPRGRKSLINGEEREGDDDLPPRKRSRTGKEGISKDQDRDLNEDTSVQTPAKPRRGRPPGSGQKSKTSVNGKGEHLKQKKSLSQNIDPFTPRKTGIAAVNESGLSLRPHVDRSARRKSTRNLLDRAVIDGVSADSDLEDENLLARKIWDAAEEDNNSDDQESNVENDGRSTSPTATTTPSKKRPGRRKKKSPTPPTNLPPHEQFFWQNRPGRVKTSDNTLSSLSLLTHEQYFNQIGAYEDPHSSSYQYLHNLHKRSFPQWRFELSQSFNICLYGYGSKQSLVQDFADYLHRHSSEPPKIIILNGFDARGSLNKLLNILAPVVYDSLPSSLPKLPAQPQDLLSQLLSHLTSSPPSYTPINIFVNSLDSPHLRRGAAPTLLSQLAAHEHISLLATCDASNFPLLWDVPTRDRYNFLFHDATTFISYADSQANSTGKTADRSLDHPPEIPSVVDSLNDLLNRSGRTIKGREGVTFVLRSLPKNARDLYRILISEILAAMDADGLDINLAATATNDNDKDSPQEEHQQERQNGDPFRSPIARNLNQVSRGSAANNAPGIEYRVLYQKTVEDFVCSSEMGFRQLLKEFWDHDMIVSLSSSGGGGTSGGGAGEVLGVPWRRDEMEAILEELLGGDE